MHFYLYLLGQILKFVPVGGDQPRHETNNHASFIYTKIFFMSRN
jgi:hypothetical protein